MEIITRKQAQQQGLIHYFTGKPCVRGHIALRLTAGACTDCRKENWKAQDESRRQKRQEDPAFDEMMKAKQRRASAAFTERNPERRQELRDAWMADPANRQRRYERQQQLKKTEQYRAVANARNLVRSETEPQFVMVRRLRARMHTAFNAARAFKSSKSQVLLGCSWQVLIEHLETLFVAGMTWENYQEWHLDHIRPCASFDLTDPAQQRVCMNWRNLQPMWGEENLAKSDTWTPAMEAEWAANMRAMGFEGELFLAFEQAVAA
jgi:hypothetical protein